MAHVGTSQAHLAAQNVYPSSGSEHIRPSPSLSLNTTGQALTSEQHSREKHVVQQQPTHKSTTMLPSHASQLLVANAHQSQACIANQYIGSTTPSSSHNELPREGGAPTFVFSATKSQNGSPLRQEQGCRSFNKAYNSCGS